MHRPGFEPGTPWSEIRRPNHCATPPPYVCVFVFYRTVGVALSSLLKRCTCLLPFGTVALHFSIYEWRTSTFDCDIMLTLHILPFCPQKTMHNSIVASYLASWRSYEKGITKTIKLKIGDCHTTLQTRDYPTLHSAASTFKDKRPNIPTVVNVLYMYIMRLKADDTRKQPDSPCRYMTQSILFGYLSGYPGL